MSTDASTNCVSATVAAKHAAGVSVEARYGLLKRAADVSGSGRSAVRRMS